MYFLDTNVVIRLFLNDTPAQNRLVERFVQQHKCSVSLTVMLEAEWVMRHLMRFTKTQVIAIFRSLLEIENIHVIYANAFASAIDAYELGLDFGDALHAAQLSADETLMTFDKDFAKKAAKGGFKQVRLLK